MGVRAFLVAVPLLALAVTLGAIALAAWRMRSRPARVTGALPPVTIVRPLSGTEPFSELTLRSGFLLDHPDYELIFCVASASDPVLPIVRRLMAAHPAIPSQLILGDEPVSPNPKLNNCVRGWEAARHDWVILADSNVLMPSDYVARLLAAWRPDTGLVCSTPVGSRPDGFWALVECAFLNTLQTRWQYAGEALGLGFAQGKSMLWHRPFLEPQGGIRALAAEIAEDAAATKLVRAAGLHVHVVDRPFEQPLGPRRLAAVWARQLRWARLRFVTFPLFFLPEILSSPLVLALLLAAGLGGGPTALLSAALLLGACYGAEMWLAWRLGWHLSAGLPLAFLVRDVIIPAMWISAFRTRNIVWHGHSMDIRSSAATGAPG